MKKYAQKRYYSDKLSAEKLKRAYEIAPPRIRQYFEAEINHVVQRMSPGDVVLDLGCGYGRIIPDLINKAAVVIGIDTSLPSLELGKKLLRKVPDLHLLVMDVGNLAIHDNKVDLIVCIQNGISAFHIDQKALLRESYNALRPGGLALFSSYSERIWEYRLQWFALQAYYGLVGEIDYNATGNGPIVCRDGFRATTVSRRQFMELTSGLKADIAIVEVNNSSLFCEIRKADAGER